MTNYTPEQTRAIESLSRRICVDAGAGSGKTRVLVDRIVHLLEGGLGTLDDVVAITFTEKAAGEMKQRLRLAFRDRASVDDPAQMTRWREFERQVEYARISTIHSFCASLLRENALRLGLDPDFAVLAEAENLLLRQEVVQETLHALIDAEDAQLRLAVTMLSLNEVERLLHRLIGQRGVLHRVLREWPWEDPEALRGRWREALEEERKRRLLGLRLDPKAGLLLRRLCALDGKCTNAADAREARRAQMIRALEQLQQASDVSAVERALQALCAPAQGRASRANWPEEGAMEAVTKVQNDVKAWAEKLVAPAELDEEVEAESARICCAVCSVFQRVDAAYAEAKRQAAAYDFDDLIEMAHAALVKQEEIRARVAAGIQFLLVDEFQDTDRVQAEILEALAREEASPGPHLFVVGDAKQSIYYFRGAEVAVFQQARGGALEVIPLDQNFRSLPDVLSFVNEVFDRSGLLNRTGAYQPLRVHRSKQDDARIEFLLEPADLEEEPSAGEYRRIEAEQIAGRILELCAPKGGLSVCDSDGTWRTARYGDMALLFQTLGDVYVYEDAFRRWGVPYQVVQGRGFFRRQELLDMLNLLKVVLDPWDEPALLAFLRSPMAGLSDEQLYWMTRGGSLSSVFQSRHVPDETREWRQLIAARDLIDALRDRAALPPAAFLSQLLDLSGYEAVLLAEFNGVQKVSNVRKLVELAADFAHNSTAPLRVFVQYLDELREQAVREGEAMLQPETTGAVLMMTIHQSKGLEFPVVFLPDMGRDRGNSWSSALPVHSVLGLGVRYAGLDPELNRCAMARAIDDRVAEEESAEHARLLYVALTRARDYLVLCGKSASDSLSWIGQLGALFALPDCPHGESLVGNGWQAKVTREVAPVKLAKERPSETQTPPWESLVQRTEPVPRGAAKVLSVSRVLDAMLPGEDMEDIDEPAREPGTADAALTRGTLVHRLFEEWDFATDTPPDLDALLSEAGLGLTEHAVRVRDLEAVVQRFRTMDVFARLHNAAQVAKEVPFDLVAGAAPIRGVVDAVAGEALLIDYKTGKFKEASHQRYVLQVSLYALAMQRLLGRAPERGVLAYVDAAREVEVPFTEEGLRTTEQLLLETVARLMQEA